MRNNLLLNDSVFRKVEKREEKQLNPHLCLSTDLPKVYRNIWIFKLRLHDIYTQSKPCYGFILKLQNVPAGLICTVPVKNIFKSIHLTEFGLHQFSTEATICVCEYAVCLCM